MNTVRKLIKQKGSHVWTTSKDSIVTDAMKLMSEKRIGSLVVVEGDNVIGIFTERDYARKIGPNNRNPEKTRIEEVMTTELITVDPSQSVNVCMNLMVDNHIRHLPVMEGGKLAGIISVGDVVKDIIEELEFHVEQLTGYIQGLR